MQREMRGLSLALLGAPEVRHDGRLLRFATRKALALLAYLAVEGGAHPREKIADLFWPDSDRARGRAALRRTLALARGALPADGGYLLAERDQLSLNPDAGIDLDTRALEAALRAGPAREGLSLLEAAWRAYRGDFLAGFSLGDSPGFDDWASLQREYWHRQMAVIFDWLSELQSESGMTGAAIDTAAAWVAHAPLDEAAHRRLMMCFFMAGNRTSALQAYAACRALLRDELGVEPSPETEALAERLRAEARPRQRASRQPFAQPPAPMLASPFVGRAAEFARLTQAYYASARGLAQSVMLEGEAGIGKTRLALEFLSWARAQGAQALHGRASEAGARVPYQPIVEVLRQPALQAALSALSPAWLAELVPLLPELRDRAPELRPAAAGEPAARLRLLEAIARLTHLGAADAPLVLFLDDAQWADAASLDVLQHAVRYWAGQNARVLLLVAVRQDDEAALAGPLWASLEREAPLVRLSLRPLTAGEALQLVRGLGLGSAGQAAPPETTPAAEESGAESFGLWLFDETAGQPFYMVETLKALIERGLIHPGAAPDGAWRLALPAAGPDAELRRAVHIPGGVQVLLRSRLARLTPSALALLTAAAVLGYAFAFETACSIAGLEENEGLGALDELLHSHLVQPAGPDLPPELLVIAHDKLCAVAYAEASEARRRVFHRRALEVLAGQGAPSGELAYHALAAGLAEPAFRFSCAAGEDAMRVFALPAAIRHYEQARSLAASLQLPAGRLQALHLKLGRAYELAGDFEQARVVYGALLKAARQAAQPAVECAALNHLATLAAQAELDFGLALQHLAAALRAAELSGDPSSLAETEWNLAQVHYYLSEPRSLSHGARALAQARKLAQPELLARALNVHAWAQADFAGDFASAMAQAEEALALYRSLGDRAMEADCLCLVANAHLGLGQLQAALESAEAARDISVAIDNVWGQAHSAFQLAKAALEMGDYTRALASAGQGGSLARAGRLLLLDLLCHSLEGTVQRSLGQPAAALELHRQARTDFEQFAPLAPTLGLMVTAELAADHAALGDWRAASAEAQRLTPLSLDRFPPFTFQYALQALVETLLHSGQDMAVSTLLQLLEQYASRDRRVRLAFLRASAAQARHGADAPRAIADLRAAAALAEDLRRPGEIWQVYAALGRVLAEQGQASEADAAWMRAAETARRLADHIDDESLRASLLAAVTAYHVMI